MAYFDNNLCSAVAGRVLANPSDEDAMRRIMAAHLAGEHVEVVTSRQSHVEQDRASSAATRQQLALNRGAVPRMLDDHVVLGFSEVSLGERGHISTPIVDDVVDPALLTALKSEGLKEGDARHLMYAVNHRCTWLVTTDPDFGVAHPHTGVDDPGLRARLEGHCCGLAIVTPSTLIELLGI